MNMSLATLFLILIFSPNGLVYTLALNCLPTSGCNLISSHTAKNKQTNKQQQHRIFDSNFNTTDRTQELSNIHTSGWKQISIMENQN